MSDALAQWKKAQQGTLPEHLGFELLSAEDGRLRSAMQIQPHHLAPNGYLHAAAVVMLADTTCGYGCMLHLPEGAQSFTTIELKSNHLGTARDGRLECEATPVHRGRRTQVWQTRIETEEGKLVALVTQTQMVL